MSRVVFLATMCSMPLFVTSAATTQLPDLLSVAIAPDGKTLVLSEGFSDHPSILNFRDLPSGDLRLVRNGHAVGINALTYSPDGKMLASGDGSGAIHLWDTKKEKELKTFEHKPGRPWNLVFSPDGRTLASISPTRVVLWEVLTGKQRAVMELDGEEVKTLGLNTWGHPAGCGVVFSPDSRTLACAAWRGTVKLFDAVTCKERCVLPGAAWCVAFDRDGRTVATASEDNTVKLWNAETGSHKATFPGRGAPVVSIAFSPDGKMAASWCRWQQNGKDWSGTEVKVWEVASGKERVTFAPEDPKYSHRAVYAMQFSANGNELLTVTLNGLSVDRWELGKLATEALGGGKK